MWLYLKKNDETTPYLMLKNDHFGQILLFSAYSRIERANHGISHKNVLRVTKKLTLPCDAMAPGIHNRGDAHKCKVTWCQRDGPVNTLRHPFTQHRKPPQLTLPHQHRALRGSAQCPAVHYTARALYPTAACWHCLFIDITAKSRV